MKTLFTGLNGFKCNKNISVCRLASYRPGYKSRLTVCCGFPLEGSKVQNSTADTHTTLPLSLSKNQTDGWNRFIFDVSMCVCFHMYMCEFYMYMSEIINVFLLISCLVRFTFTLSQSPCWVSLLALTWKEKCDTHTHTHMCSGGSPLKSSPSLVNVQCDSEVTEGQISSMQLILSQKQTSASDPPTDLNSDLFLLELSLSPLFSFFMSEQKSHSLIIVRLTGQEVERYYHLLKRALFIRHMTKNMELKCSLHSCIILETAILSDLYKDSFQMLIIIDNAKNN